MLTHEQAVYFLEKKLLMPLNWWDLLQKKPLEFLTTYMKRHAILVPFQNAFMTAVEDGYRRFPSEKDLIDIGLTGNGGCCIQLNYFSMLVFKAIGLDSFVVRGDHYCAPIAGTHCMVMVTLRTPEDHGTYMIEVGGGFPMLQPVPMDSHKLPFRVVEAAGFPYEFREIAPGWVGKFHLDGGLMGGKFTDKSEILRTSWEMKARALWEFDYPMLATFTKPQYSVLLRVPYMYRFFTNTEVARLFPQLSPQNGTSSKGGKQIGCLVPVSKSIESQESSKKGPNLLKLIEETENLTISNEPQSESDLDNPVTFIFAYKRRIVIGDSKSRKIVTNYDSYDEMLLSLSKYFPSIPLAVLTLAMEKFNAYEVLPSPYDGIFEMLTYDQAVYFLEKILLMPLDWRDVLQNKPLTFLTTYIKRHAIILPFQNSFMAAEEEEYRRFPSEQDIIDIGLSGQGGCCIHKNYFTMLVLKAVGMDSFVVRGDHYRAPVAGTHCIAMVKLHTQDDPEIYMIEVGGAFPMRQPIPMNSNRLPLIVVEAAGFPYEFRQMSSGWIGKFHLEGGLMGGKFTDKKETLRTCWDLKPRALWEFDYPMLTTFAMPQYSALLCFPYMFRFFTNTEVTRLFPEFSKPNGETAEAPEGPDEAKTSNAKSEEITNQTIEANHAKLGLSCENGEGLSDLDNPTTFAFVYKRRIVIGDSKTRKLVQNYDSYEEMLIPLSKYFPTIPFPVLSMALQKFSSYEILPSPTDGML